VDKDQVLSVMDEVAHRHDNGSLAFDSLREARAAVADIYAELESLRAMRKRVEGLYQQYAPYLEGDAPSPHDHHARACETFAEELREALGDSHE
jgi:hypothetical protein